MPKTKDKPKAAHPVTITVMQFVSCEICQAPLAYMPGMAPAVLTDHYNRNQDHLERARALRMELQTSR